jgi:XTP/dITP diphosphohydrolase
LVATRNLETADTIEGNSVLKANYVTERYGCFADDTGLEVEALNGAPGVFSAYAGEQRSAADNMDKLLQVLSNQSNRNAQFKTVVTLNLNGKHLFTGIARARLPIKVGKEGFGYDPIFQPEGYQQTFAELSSELKDQPQGRQQLIS